MSSLQDMDIENSSTSMFLFNLVVERCKTTTDTALGNISQLVVLFFIALNIVCISSWIYHHTFSKLLSNRVSTSGCQSHAVQSHTVSSTSVSRLLICFSALIGTSQAQSTSTQSPESISQELTSIIPIISIIGAVLLLAVVGVLVYCTCRYSWKRRTEAGSNGTHTTAEPLTLLNAKLHEGDAPPGYEEAVKMKTVILVDHDQSYSSNLFHY